MAEASQVEERRTEWEIVLPSGEKKLGEFTEPLTRSEAYAEAEVPLPRAPAEKAAAQLRPRREPTLWESVNTPFGLAPQKTPSEAGALLGLMAGGGAGMAMRLPVGVPLLLRALGVLGGAEAGGAIEGEPFGKAAKEAAPGLALGEAVGGGMGVAGRQIQTMRKGVNWMSEKLARGLAEQIKKLVPPLGQTLPKNVTGYDLSRLLVHGDESLRVFEGRAVEAIEQVAPGLQFTVVPPWTAKMGDQPIPVKFSQIHDWLKDLGYKVWRGKPDPDWTPVTAREAQKDWIRLLDDAVDQLNQISPDLGKLYRETRHVVAMGHAFLGPLEKVFARQAESVRVVPRQMQAEFADPEVMRRFENLLGAIPERIPQTGSSWIAATKRALTGERWKVTPTERARFWPQGPEELESLYQTLWGGGLPGTATEPGRGLLSLLHMIFGGRGEMTAYGSLPAGQGYPWTRVPGARPGPYRVSPGVQTLLDVLGLEAGPTKIPKVPRLELRWDPTEAETRPEKLRTPAQFR